MPISFEIVIISHKQLNEIMSVTYFRADKPLWAVLVGVLNLFIMVTKLGLHAICFIFKYPKLKQ